MNNETLTQEQEQAFTRMNENIAFMVWVHQNQDHRGRINEMKKTWDAERYDMMVGLSKAFKTVSPYNLQSMAQTTLKNSLKQLLQGEVNTEDYSQGTLELADQIRNLSNELVEECQKEQVHLEVVPRVTDAIIGELFVMPLRG